MRLLQIKADNVGENEEFIKQYHALMDKDSKRKPPETYLRAIKAGKIIALLLVDDDRNQLLAGVTLRDKTDKLADGIHLPKDSSARIGYIGNLVSSARSALWMPGLQLQMRILDTFKKGLLGVDILAAHIAQTNTLSAQEAIEGAGLRSVVRNDLTKEIDGKKSYFVAIASSNDRLVPEGYESHIFSPDKLQELAHQALACFKEEHRPKRTPPVTPSL